MSPSPSSPLKGIALAVGAMACFAALDTTTKLVGIAVPVVMLLWVRYLFQTLFTAATLLPRRGRRLLHTDHPRLQIARGALLASASTLAVASLRHIGVGEFTAIVSLTPLLLTLMAGLMLGERVSALRWTLVAGGFAGVLMIIQPGGEGFTLWTLGPLVILLLNTGFQLLTAKLARLEDPVTMQLYTGAVGAVGFSLLLPFVWQPLTALQWGLIGLLSTFGTVGHGMLVHSYGHAQASTLTPYLYFQVGFAMLGGWLVFAHAPDAWALLGVTLIALCGVVGTWLSGREQRAAA